MKDGMLSADNSTWKFGAGWSRIVPLVVICVFVAGCATTPSRPIATSRADDQAQILSALQGSADAWNRGDIKGHLAVYVDTATFMTATGPRPGVAQAEAGFLRSYWRDGRPRQTLRFEQVAIRWLDEGAALQTGHFILSGGGEPEQSGWFTLIWQRTGQGWRIVHDHAS
jgi:ketosteroid isomerase-like protein